MGGNIVEKNLTVAGHVNSHLTELIPLKYIRRYTVEKNLIVVGHVISHLLKLVT